MEQKGFLARKLHFTKILGLNGFIEIPSYSVKVAKLYILIHLEIFGLISKDFIIRQTSNKSSCIFLSLILNILILFQIYCFEVKPKKKKKTKVLKNIHVILLAIPFFQILMSLLITVIIKSNFLTNIKMSPIHQRAKKIGKTFNEITCI